MPRGDTHAFFERAMLGKVTPMSDVMDMMHPILHSHHRAFGHDARDILALAAMLAGEEFTFEELVVSGLLHLLVDEAFAASGTVKKEGK